MDILCKLQHVLLCELRKQAIPKYNIFENLQHNDLIKNHIFSHKLFKDGNIIYHDLAFALDIIYDNNPYTIQCKYVCDTNKYNKSMLVEYDEIINSMLICIHSRKMRYDDLPCGIYEEKYPYQITINPDTGNYDPLIFVPEEMEIIFPTWNGIEWQ